MVPNTEINLTDDKVTTTHVSVPDIPQLGLCLGWYGHLMASYKNT